MKYRLLFVLLVVTALCGYGVHLCVDLYNESGVLSYIAGIFFLGLAGVVCFVMSLVTFVLPEEELF